MPFQPVPQSAEVFTRVIGPAGNVYGNRYVCRFSTAYAQADLELLVDTVSSWFGASIRPLLTSEQAYLGAEARGLSSAIDLQASSVLGAGVGGSSAVLFPQNVTKAFTLRTGNTGRSARGRWFFPTLNNNHVETNENRVIQGFVDAVTLALLDLIDDVNSAGWTWVVLSRYTGNALRPTGLTFPITEIGVSDNTTDSMRSRLPEG